MNARPFLFDEDFRAPKIDDAAGVSEMEHQMAVDNAERAGFARGLAEARAEAEAATARHLADAVGRIEAGVAPALAALDAHLVRIEEEALAFALELGRRLAGRAVDAQPLAAITEAAREAMRHLRGVPHLAVRVDPLLVEEVDRVLTAMARERGFEGRLIVLGDDGLTGGEVRLEWADGGVVRTRASADAALDAVFASVPRSAAALA